MSEAQGNDGLQFLERSQLAMARAAKDPVPGPVGPAFLESPIKVCGVSLRTLTVMDLITLKAIDSPLWSGLSDGSNIAMEPGAIMDAIYVLSVPPDVARKLAAANPNTAIREAALQLLGNLSLSDYRQLLEALRLILERSTSTSQSYSAEQKDGSSFFGSAGPKTAPAPSSTL